MTRWCTYVDKVLVNRALATMCGKTRSRRRGAGRQPGSTPISWYPGQKLERLDGLEMDAWDSAVIPGKVI